jgi:hypothetical protein
MREYAATIRRWDGIALMENYAGSASLFASKLAALARSLRSRFI